MTEVTISKHKFLKTTNWKNLIKCRNKKKKTKI
jgi:hypothetical protein